MNVFTKATFPLAIGAVGLAPLLLAVPAQASTTDSGCTVNPLRPVYSGVNSASNIPLVDYKFEVTCDPGLIAEVQQFRLEEDVLPRDIDAIDDVTGNSLVTLDFTSGAATRTVRVRKALPKTPGDGAVEEVLHKVRFRVTSGPVTSSWTPFEATSPRSIHR